MANSRDAPPERDPLEPVLREVEAELKRRLTEACTAEAEGIENESAAEIRRLEDALLAAAVAAEQAIALRRHMTQPRAENTNEAPAALAEAQPNDTAMPTTRVREFRDATGQLWRAWPVTPGQARQGRTAERYLGEFHKGWICFESLDTPARRRLPQQRPDWSSLSGSELANLLDQAISAPKRKPRKEVPRPPLQ
jgi:hypothetical protein